jgi:ATP-dependent helicase/nuclease subunit A
MSRLKKEYELKQEEDRELRIPALYASSELPDIKSQWMDTRLSSAPSEERSAVEEGLLMHRVLELIVRREDLPKAVLTVVEEGQIPAAEFDHWIERIERAFAIEEVNRWFADGVEVLNERDILLPDGRRYRPDRVVLEGSKAVLLDYKTGSPGRHYHRQLQTYADVVSQMGYSEVEGWLFYTDVLQVERVV